MSVTTQHREDDGGRDEGHDAQGEDGGLADGTAGERRQQAEQVLLAGGLEKLRAHPGDGDVEPNAVANQQAKGPEDALPSLGDLEQP